ncbi:hypothetical protein AB1207_02265 [Kineococcus endophyticus]|uniref:Alkaline phosphatase n=1 Tax=Kineococcus endophyticus TaxID=1181883 RepID=A0ABV3P1T4_9ACTN
MGPVLPDTGSASTAGARAVSDRIGAHRLALHAAWLLRRGLGLLLLLSLVLVVAAAPAQAASDTGTGRAPVVLVGFSGVRWTDVSTTATPALASMTSGAIGTVAVRSVFTAACPVDGWLGLSAGRRATAFDGTDHEHEDAACAPVADPVGGVQPDFTRYRQIAEDGTFDAVPGTLGQALADGGATTLSIGPGAGIALARTDGSLGDHLSLSSCKYTAPAVVGEDVQRALESGTDVVVVDAGTVRDPADLPARESAPTTSRATQVAAVDAAVAAVQQAVDDSTGAEATTVLAVSLADSGKTPHLQYAAATGPRPASGSSSDSARGDYRGLLGSRATREQGIVQTTDLTPTVLALALGSDHGTAGLVGAPVTSTDAGLSAAQRREKVEDLDAAAQAVQPLVAPFFVLWGATQLVLYAVGALALRRGWGGSAGRRRILRGLRTVAVLYGSVGASTFLANTIPWWRAGSSVGAHLLAVTGAVALYATLVTALALLGPWRRGALGPVGFVGFTTAAVLAVDCATGSRLITSSLNGEQPVVAGRFYGLGNQEFALFATGSLLFAVAVADHLVRAGRRRAAVAVVAVVGVAATFVDGVLGSDFGGPPALLPAFGLLALVVGGVRATARRVVLLLGATVLVLVAISVADWLRPADDQTHLGRFVQSVLDGGAWLVIGRKAVQNAQILSDSWLLVLLLGPAAVFLAVALARPAVLGASGAAVLQRAYDQHPVLRPGLASLLVLLAIGFAANDSGTVVPAVGAMLAVPLLIALLTRVLEVPAALLPDPAPAVD